MNAKILIFLTSFIITVTSQTETMGSGYAIEQGQCLVATTNAYRACMNIDGDFVVYNTSSVLWHMSTSGKGTALYHLVMEERGSLIFYDGKNASLWFSANHTINCTKPAYLQMQHTDGNLVVYDRC